MILQHEKFHSGRVNVQLRPDVYFQKQYDNGRLVLPDDAEGAIVRAELLKQPDWQDITPVTEPPRTPNAEAAADPFRAVIMRHPLHGQRDVSFGSFRVAGHDRQLTCDDDGKIVVSNRKVFDELKKIGFSIIGIAEPESENNSGDEQERQEPEEYSSQQPSDHGVEV